MMNVFTGSDTYVFEMTRGLITAEELMDIFKHTDDPVYIKGSDGKWCRVETVFKSKSRTVTPVMFSIRDGVNTVLGSNSVFRCPAGDFYNPRVTSKHIRELLEKDMIVLDNMESFQNIKLPEETIKKIAYIARYFRYIDIYNNGCILEVFRATVPEIDSEQAHALEDMFRCTIVYNGNNTNIASVGVTNNSFNTIKEYAKAYGINMRNKSIPKIIWRCDINSRKLFWKYFTQFDDFPSFLDKSTGKYWAEFSLRDRQRIDKFKIFLASIGINCSIQYKKARDVYSIIVRGSENIGRLIDPFTEITKDNTKTWAYSNWSVYTNKDGETDTVLASSKERYEIYKDKCKNSFFKEYYRYNTHTKIKSIKACDSKMIGIAVSDKDVYISLNGILVRGV